MWDVSTSPNTGAVSGEELLVLSEGGPLIASWSPDEVCHPDPRWGLVHCPGLGPFDVARHRHRDRRAAF